MRSISLRDKRGASLVEFALLVAVLFALGVPAVSSLGNNVSAGYYEATDAIAGSCNGDHGGKCDGGIAKSGNQ